MKKVEKAEVTEHPGLPPHLLQFPQELDGPGGRDVGPVEEREAAAVDGEGVVGEGVVWRRGGGGTEENNQTPVSGRTGSSV